jgi:anti-sigma-K factor RskA
LSKISSQPDLWRSSAVTSSTVPVAVALGGRLSLSARRAGAPTSAVVLLVVAALSFGFDHGFPTGTIGMVALFAAGLLLERHPAAASPEPERVASGLAPAA